MSSSSAIRRGPSNEFRWPNGAAAGHHPGGHPGVSAGPVATAPGLLGVDSEYIVFASPSNSPLSVGCSDFVKKPRRTLKRTLHSEFSGEGWGVPTTKSENRADVFG